LFTTIISFLTLGVTESFHLETKRIRERKPSLLAAGLTGIATIGDITAVLHHFSLLSRLYPLFIPSK
jgi:hypothetical protein